METFWYQLTQVNLDKIAENGERERERERESYINVNVVCPILNASIAFGADSGLSTAFR